MRLVHGLYQSTGWRALLCSGVFRARKGKRGRSSVAEHRVKPEVEGSIPFSFSIATSSVGRAPDCESGCRGFDPRFASAFGADFQHGEAGRFSSRVHRYLKLRRMGAAGVAAPKRSAHSRIPSARSVADAGAPASSPSPRSGQGRTRDCGGYATHRLKREPATSAWRGGRQPHAGLDRADTFRDPAATPVV